MKKNGSTKEESRIRKRCLSNVLDKQLTTVINKTDAVKMAMIQIPLSLYILIVPLAAHLSCTWLSCVFHFFQKRIKKWYLTEHLTAIILQWCLLVGLKIYVVKGKRNSRREEDFLFSRSSTKPRHLRQSAPFTGN